MQFTFTVPGKPIPKARPRLGKGRRAFTPQRTLDYEALLKEHCLPSIPEGWDVEAEYEVDMVFYFADRTHGDLDNHAKMLDGLNPKVVRRKRKVISREDPFVWGDDKQVKKLTIAREYVDDSPRLVVTILACPNLHKKKTRTKAPRSPSPATSAKASSKRTTSRRRPSNASYSPFVEMPSAFPDSSRSSTPAASSPSRASSKRRATVAS